MFDMFRYRHAEIRTLSEGVVIALTVQSRLLRKFQVHSGSPQVHRL
jgi:hypothetical protein